VTTDGPEPATAPGHGRAGRDLRAATAVGLGLAVLVVGTLFVWKPAFVGLAVVAIAVAVWELGQALVARDIRVPLVPVLLGSVLMVVGAYVGGYSSSHLASPWSRCWSGDSASVRTVMPVT
jgi:phosphatidate cytidylyltransferase